jgi:hypothetical protein
LWHPALFPMRTLRTLIFRGKNVLKIDHRWKNWKINKNEI